MSNIIKQLVKIILERTKRYRRVCVRPIRVVRYLNKENISSLLKHGYVTTKEKIRFSCIIGMCI
jgi:hypothetical protein